MSVLDRIRDLLSRAAPALPVQAHLTYETPLGLTMLDVARGELGHGEDGANNRGADLRRYGVGEGQEWCAAFVGYCLRAAATRLSYSLPFAPSLGARKLWRQVCAAGSRPERPAPGDVVCWARGRDGWSGHIGIVESVDDEGLLHTIEGNTGPYPSVVRRRVHEVERERLLGYGRIG